jgi:hypothetical protein
MPSAITAEPKDLPGFQYLMDGGFIDANKQNEADFVVRSVTPLGHAALEKKTNWPMISALIALALLIYYIAPHIFHAATGQ